MRCNLLKVWSGMPTDVQRFLEEYVDASLAFHPTSAAGLGLHEYDGQIGDYSAAAIAARARALAEFRNRAAALDRGRVSPQDAHDLALVERSLRHEQFEWTDLREHERNPLAYSHLLDITNFLKRQYAPLPERVQGLIAHLDGIPDALAQARTHLERGPIPKPFAGTALDVYRGYVTFFETTLPATLTALEDRPLYELFLRANDLAASSLRGFVRWLEEDVTPRAIDDFAIGERLYSRMLATGELVDLPLDDLLKVGEEELRRNTDAVTEAAGQIDPSRSPADVIRQIAREHPTEETLLADTRRMLEDLREFLVERNLVTVPTEVRPIVEATPPFARWAFAMMDTAGPFEEVATESFYYVTPPEATWSPEQKEEWLSKFDYYTLNITSIHEAYPGHFIHFLHVKGAPSRPARIFTSYSFVEGWAHYTEEMMVEQGADPNPKFRLAQVIEALVRNVRYLVAIKMHARAMTVDEATQMFMQRAFMEALPARKEAVRGTFDPGYLNYLLGKLMVRKLRADVQAEQGARFSLRAFHDQLLALGAPPLPLARRALLGRDDGVLL